MIKRILLLSMIILTLISISAVAAEDNTTDVIANASDEVITQDAGWDEDVLNVNETPQTKEPSAISASDVKGYESFKTEVSFKLTSNDKPLALKTVSISINGASYSKTTDSNGEASLEIDLKTGSYDAVFTYLGDDLTGEATATSKITISKPVKTSLKIGDKNINYRQGSKCLFYVKLTDKNGKAIKNQVVSFTAAGKTYSSKTNSKGIAKIYLKLKKGKHKVKYSFKKSAPYLASHGSFTVKVKAKMAKGNGYWLWSEHMKKINLKSISKKGTKHILLHVHSIALYGKPAVVSFIKKAHKRGIKVHLWMQVAYSGGKWVSLVDGKGKLKYSFMNKKISQAKKYAKIKGVDGIHFDYIRYGGTAHKHPHAVDSVNYFSKKASIQIHKVKKNCIVSAAIMPEPSSMKSYYGQDVSKMSRYMDVLIPMVYKGNYHQKTKWIGSVTKTFVKQSSGAQIWTGLQSYHSDSNAKKLTQKSLLKDARSAKSGGAKGVMLFRIGLSCNFNFKKV